MNEQLNEWVYFSNVVGLLEIKSDVQGLYQYHTKNTQRTSKSLTNQMVYIRLYYH